MRCVNHVPDTTKRINAFNDCTFGRHSNCGNVRIFSRFMRLFLNKNRDDSRRRIEITENELKIRDETMYYF